MEPNKLLLVSITLTSTLTGLSSPVKAGEKPNILFIMTDQQSHNMMSCMGNEWLETPNMDYLANNGYRFERAYCVNPVSQPSRFSLLTGHYASEVGVKENTAAYDKAKVDGILQTGSLGNLFRQAGYQTLYSGKIHLYGTKDVSEYGFNLNGVDPYDGPAIYAEQAFSTMDRNKPFFMFLSFMNPHDICYKAGMDKRFPHLLPKEKVVETIDILKYKEQLPEEEYSKQVPALFKNDKPINGEQIGMVEMDTFPRSWNLKKRELYSWMYHRLTESVDEQIGRVLTALKKSGLDDNTIIVFTSDHGDMNGAHRLVHKNVMFEECQRIPFMFVGKGIAKGYADKENLVCNGLDLLPTLCEFAGIEAPANLEGKSLVPLLRKDATRLDRDYIITESYNSFQIHDGRFKYTVYELPGNPEILTDIKVDPGETVNLADAPEFRAQKKLLQHKLMTFLDRRNMLPLSQNRTIGEVRKAEKLYKKKHSRKQN